jgi:hypothetical protein
MSLTTCLKQAGDALSKENRKALMAEAARLRKQGKDAKTAALKAIDKQIKLQRNELATAEAQHRAATTQESTDDGVMPSWSEEVARLTDAAVDYLFTKARNPLKLKVPKGATTEQKRAVLAALDEDVAGPFRDQLYEDDADYRFLEDENRTDRAEPGETFTDYPGIASFAEPEKTVDATKDAGKNYMPIDQGQAIVQSWKDEAARIGREEDHSNEIVFSFFDVSGNISKPWRDAGYDVRQYDIELGDDLFRYVPMADIQEALASGKKIKAVLAQPPCTTFTTTGRQWHETHHDANDRARVNKMFGPHAAQWFSKPHEYAHALVAITDMLAGELNPEILLLENPNGGGGGETRLHEFPGMPKPVLDMQPHVYGDPYTKRTLLWGRFNPNLPTANVEPTLGSYMHKLFSSAEKKGGLRSQTPEGFAYAFFMANHQPGAAAALDKPAEKGALPAEPAKPAEAELKMEPVEPQPAALPADAGKPSKPTGGRTARNAAWERNPLKAFLANHGIALELANEFAPGQKERRAAMVPGYGPIFRKNGKQLDALAEAAWQEGFTPTEDANKLYELIAKVMAGQRVAPEFGQDANDQAKSRYDEAMARMQEDPSSDPLANIEDDELPAMDEVRKLDLEEQRQFAALVEAAEAEGIDTEAIIMETAHNGDGHEFRSNVTAQIERARAAIRGSDDGGRQPAAGAAGGAADAGQPQQAGRSGQEAGQQVPRAESGQDAGAQGVGSPNEQAGALVSAFRSHFGKEPSGMSLDQWRAFHDERNAAEKQLATELLAIADKSPDGLLLPLRHNHKTLIALHRDPKKEGAWRTTFFIASTMEPSGHQEYRTPLEAAIDDLGEKIGGARKDTAESTGRRASKPPTRTAGPRGRSASRSARSCARAARSTG